MFGHLGMSKADATAKAGGSAMQLAPNVIQTNRTDMVAIKQAAQQEMVAANLADRTNNLTTAYSAQVPMGTSPLVYAGIGLVGVGALWFIWKKL